MSLPGRLVLGVSIIGVPIDHLTQWTHPGGGSGIRAVRIDTRQMKLLLVVRPTAIQIHVMVCHRSYTHNLNLNVFTQYYYYCYYYFKQIIILFKNVYLEKQHLLNFSNQKLVTITNSQKSTNLEMNKSHKQWSKKHNQKLKLTQLNNNNNKKNS